MVLPEWSSQLSIGLKPVDDNHQLLFKLLHIIHAEATYSGEGMVALLTALLTLSMCHFRCEEDWMTRLAFAGTALHKEEHDAFVARVTSYRTAFMKGEAVNKGLVFFLESWMVQHFCSTNKEFRIFLLQNGYVTNRPGKVVLDI
ncbi:bacteriohemerythrin [Geomonas anaerohicana]|uniref:Bacteriohemerythrin n=1 Tax=Geomonas anaerohicana TaxID=2798583 RepID=A0ABS0YGC6_9BACT|nr:bacteriohemerythrin [Geomonas anaerohicana]MBJ6751374.1 bacteriohemerythrin [Geomonas anaerohicana]